MYGYMVSDIVCATAGLCGILGDASVLQLLMDMKMNPLEINENNEIFLHVAAEHNQADILKRFSNKIMCLLTVCHRPLLAHML